MASDLESVPCSRDIAKQKGPGDWLRIGAVAAVSAVAAGFALNWFYRQTLIRLRQAEPHTENPDFKIVPSDGLDDV
jgi:hypothetical protein